MSTGSGGHEPIPLNKYMSDACLQTVQMNGSFLNHIIGWSDLSAEHGTRPGWQDTAERHANTANLFSMPAIPTWKRKPADPDRFRHGTKSCHSKTVSERVVDFLGLLFIRFVLVFASHTSGRPGPRMVERRDSRNEIIAVLIGDSLDRIERPSVGDQPSGHDLHGPNFAIEPDLLHYQLSSHVCAKRQ